MTLSVMVDTGDQSIVWVSNSFAEHVGVSSSDLIGGSVFALLEGSPSALWHRLFTGIESVDEHFDEVRVRLVGGPIDDFELRAARYVDGGRYVMISLRTVSSRLGSGDAARLAELEQRHSQLLSGSFDAVVVHDGSSVLFVNDAAARLIGLDAGAAVGMPIGSLIHPRRAVDTESGGGADEHSGGQRTLLLLRRVTGAFVEVEASVALVSWRGRRAVQIVLHDLSLQRHSEWADALREVVEDAVSDAVVSTDENLRIVDWNRAASKLYGWSSDEILGLNIGEVLGPADDSLVVSGTADSLAKSAWMGIVRHRHRDGHELLVESAQIILRNGDGGVGGLLEVNRKINTIAGDDATMDQPRSVGTPDDAAFAAEVRAALANGEISVAYQPIVELDTRRLVKLEALARWTHPQRGVVRPDQFIPRAERSGVIDQLGEWILQRACSDVLRMDGEGIDVELSVNMSVVQLRDPAASQRIARLVSDTGFPPGRLWIEVTESVLLDDRAIMPLQTFHDIGIRLAIDDFGTGYATFQNITRLPVDALKVDTMFVSGLGIDARDTAIVRSVISLSRDLGLVAVAEGVETESQRSELLALKCQFGQGWLFGRAVPFGELVTRYRNSTPTLSMPSTGPDDQETIRLTALRACRILDTHPDVSFDALVELSSQLLSTPMAVISFIDADRQWFKARVGVEATEAPRDAFCAHLLAAPLVALIVPEAPDDRQYSDSPLVTGPLNIRAYAGAPIRSREGLLLGVLSVLDIRPRDYTPEQITQLQLLAEQAAALLDLRRNAAELDDLNHSRRPSIDAGTAPESPDPINTDATHVGQPSGHPVTASPPTPASAGTSRLTPTTKLSALDPQAGTARLVASRSLLRVDTVEAAVGVCIALVRELGGRTIPARLDDGRAIPIDCSFGHGEPLLPVADSPLARLRLERVLPEVLEDARVVISRIRRTDDLKEQARTDPLTGLMNRRAADRVLKRLHADDALVAIDLDHFKLVNDTWGHAAGDGVLIAYSRALRSSGRSSDQFARLGGEELLVVLAGANEEGLAAFLGRLHETWLAIRPFEVTYSAGCAWRGGRSGTETLGLADAALYRAKQTGRDRAIIEPRESLPASSGHRPPDAGREGKS